MYLKKVNNAFLYKTQLTLFSVPPMLGPLRSTLDSPTFNCNEDYYHWKKKQKKNNNNKKHRNRIRKAQAIETMIRMNTPS